jgi:hypothetical protein
VASEDAAEDVADEPPVAAGVDELPQAVSTSTADTTAALAAVRRCLIDDLQIRPVEDAVRTASPAASPLRRERYPNG